MPLEQRIVRKTRTEQPNLRPPKSDIVRISSSSGLSDVVPVKQKIIEKPDLSAGRKRLRLDSPIVDAPAIGPKTAARFQSKGYMTIRDLLETDAKQIALDLDTSWISERLVAQWKIQSQLALAIDRLTAVGAGLIVLSGIQSVQEFATQDATKLRSRFYEAIRTSEGRRLVRDQDPPSLQIIEQWIDSAKDASSA